MLQIPFCKVHLLAVGNGELPRQGALRQGGHAEGCVVAIAGRVGFARQGLGVKPCGRLGNKLDIFFDTYREAMDFGVQYVDVYLAE